MTTEERIKSDPEDEHADRVWGPGNWVACVDCTSNGWTHYGVTRHSVEFNCDRSKP